jgi:hypothetical protein
MGSQPADYANGLTPNETSGVGQSLDSILNLDTSDGANGTGLDADCTPNYHPPTDEVLYTPVVNPDMTGYWYCCICRGLTVPQNADERCPVCGHYKCYNCPTY